MSKILTILFCVLALNTCVAAPSLDYCEDPFGNVGQ